MPRQKPKFGDVFFIDLTPHTLPSQSTMKDFHPVVIVQSDIFSHNYPNTIVVPCKSFNPEKHWDYQNKRLKYIFHYLLLKEKYTYLKNNTVVKCEQIFTISKDYLKPENYWFTLYKDDMIEILRRMSLVIGFLDIDEEL